MTPTERRREAHRVAYERLQQALDIGPGDIPGASEADLAAVEKQLDKIVQRHFELWQGPAK